MPEKALTGKERSSSFDSSVDILLWKLLEYGSLFVPIMVANESTSSRV